MFVEGGRIAPQIVGRTFICPPGSIIHATKIKEERNHLLRISVGGVKECMCSSSRCCSAWCVYSWLFLHAWPFEGANESECVVTCQMKEELLISSCFCHTVLFSLQLFVVFFLSPSLLFAQVEAETSPFQPVDRRLTRHG